MEKCLVATSLAVLLCHPNTSIKCFKPKPRPSSCLNPADENDTPLLPDTTSSPQQKKKQDHHTKSSCSMTLASRRRKTKHLQPRMYFFKTEVTGSENDYFSKGVTEIMLQQGWNPRISFKIDNLFKINHNDEAVNKFEEYREFVMMKAKAAGHHMEDYKRLVSDGNEILCFRGTTCTCNLGLTDESDNICNEKSCGVCRLIKVICLSPIDNLYPITFSVNSWQAHETADKKFDQRKNSVSSIRNAIVICRVIAGYVAGYQNDDKEFEDDKDSGFEFDSALLSGGDVDDCAELLVLNPCAVLPCFVALYSV